MTDPRGAMTQLHAIADILLDVERTLRRHGLWHSEVPTPAAMASRTPFCADTLSFTQWLQFVFLPRMRRIVEHAEPLPGASGIAVMAREALPDAAGRDRLIAGLERFDALIARAGDTGGLVS